MKFALRDGEYDCRNCGRNFPGGQLDRWLWCPGCRREVIRRATRIARVVGLGTAAILGFWIFSIVGTSPRFFVAYMVMIVAAYFFLFKMTQRVAFELIRRQGVPAPPETPPEDDES